ncbi:MAG: divalent-cation tolerance protein CutA [Gemmatimonadales bacterium]
MTGTGSDCLQVITAVGSRAEAEALAAMLVQERLAGCVQILGPVHSHYRWQGKIEQADEWICQCKSTQTRYPALAARMRELHSYETPEIIATIVTATDPDYLAWLVESVRQE